MKTQARLRRSPARAAVVALALLTMVAAGCMPDDARSVLDRTNALRASAGVSALAEHDTLTNKAEAWAQHLAATGQLAHSNLASGLGDLPWRSLGENVGVSPAGGDPLGAVHDRWAASSGHRANMLNRGFTHMGVGVATGADGRVWVVQVFAGL